MFNITKTIEYALIALRHINNGGDKVYTSKEIASLYNIPGELLAKILQKLCKKGWQKKSHNWDFFWQAFLSLASFQL